MTNMQMYNTFLFEITSDWRCAFFHKEQGREELSREIMQRVTGKLEMARSLGIDSKKLGADCISRYWETVPSTSDRQQKQTEEVV